MSSFICAHRGDNLVDWTTQSLIGFSCSQRNRIETSFFVFFFCLLFSRPVFSFSRWFSAWVQAGCSLSECTKVCAKIFIALVFYLDSSSLFFTQIRRVRHGLDSGKNKSKVILLHVDINRIFARRQLACWIKKFDFFF